MRENIIKMKNNQFLDRLLRAKDNRIVSEIMPIILLVLTALIFQFTTNGRFFRASVMESILAQCLIVATVATGASFIYTPGNIDFSLGNAVALAATLGAEVYMMTNNVIAMIVVSVLSGALMMIFNGTLSVVLNVRTTAIAVVMSQVYKAISAEIIGGEDLRVPYDICANLENGGFRYIVFILFIAMAIYIFHFTKFGRSLRFIGGNGRCAAQTGIQLGKYIFLSFLVAGIAVGLGGIFTIIRSSSVTEATAQSMGMDVMLATVLGGMSIIGGSKSKAYAGVIGALFVVVLNKGLLMSGVDASLVQGVRGILFIIFISISYTRPDTMPIKQVY